MTPRLAKRILQLRQLLVAEHNRAKLEAKDDPLTEILAINAEFKEFLATMHGNPRYDDAALAKLDAWDKRNKAAWKRERKRDLNKLIDRELEAEFLLHDFDSTFRLNHLEEQASKLKQGGTEC